jgi:ferritin-like metal-binding protein YciE
MEKTRENYLAWVRDAHAMEEQAVTMMTGMIGRLENYPTLRERLQQHVAETEQQADALKSILEGHETENSMLKDTIGMAMAKGQALSGLFVSDEIIKGLMASYTFEHMEIAAYRVLIKTAQKLGETEAERVFVKSLAQEQAMADFLADQLEPTTGAFIAREEADLTAKR